MTRYQVCFTRNASEDAACIVEAEDEDAAKDAATEMESTLEYVPGDWAAQDYEIYDVSEVDPATPLGDANRPLSRDDIPVLDPRALRTIADALCHEAQRKRSVNGDGYIQYLSPDETDRVAAWFIAESKKPPATREHKAKRAVELLQEARDLLKDAGASRSIDKLRAVMSSCKGAVRAARMRDWREYADARRQDDAISDRIADKVLVTR